jgi:hypothetical protein
MKKQKLPNEEWEKLAIKNAKHGAELHIEVENSKKIAESLKDIPTVHALEFLFKKAEKYRREHKHSKAAAILEAAELIDRKTGLETEIILQTKGTGKNADTTLSVRRFTPKQIFDEPIVYHEIIDEE